MRAAFLLIDFQHDFLNSPGLLPSAASVVDRAALLLRGFREAGAPVLHIRTTVSLDPDNRMPHWRQAGRMSCLKGTKGHEAPVLLREWETEDVLHKSGFSASGLVEWVARRGPEIVFVSGVMLHACVRQAVLSLHEAGYRVRVVEDAVASDDPTHAAITRRYLEERGIAFVPAADLTKQMGSKFPPSADESETAAVADVVRRARAEFRHGIDTPFAERVALVDRLARRLSTEADSLARQMAVELGKPVRFSGAEVSRTVEMIGAIIRRLSRAEMAFPVVGARVLRRPLGVVAVITPWNNPIYISLGKIIPAFLCGNTVVWKPAPEASGISNRVHEWFFEEGWPPDAVGLIEGRSSTARRLMAHPEIGAVTITGSLAAGYGAGEICARRHLPLQAELGGNNASIVWADADLATAAAEIAKGAFEMAGQRCTANRRVIVDRSCLPAFLDLLKSAVAGLVWGAPLDPETRIGPLVNHEHRERVEALVKRAIADGATTFHPLGREPAEQCDPMAPWFPPTIVIGLRPDHEIIQEETFGPVLVVQEAGDWDEALSLCNGVRQGLAASIFTDCPHRADRFLAEAEAGILKINASTADAAIDVPFSGWKASGTGPPEHGDHDLEFYTRIQTLYT